MAKKPQKKHQEKKTNTVSTFEIKNKLLRVFNLLIDVPLHSEQAVARNRISKLIQEKFAEFETDWLELIERYAKKDEKSGEKILDEDGKNFLLADSKGFDREWEILRNTPAVFDVLPSNRQYFKTIAKVIQDTDMKMDIELTDLWEELLDAFKEI
jgi:hypothetical protein